MIGLGQTPGTPTPHGQRVYGATYTPPGGVLTNIWDALTLQHLNPVQPNAPDFPAGGALKYGAQQGGGLLGDVLEPIAAPVLLGLALVAVIFVGPSLLKK